MSAKSIVARIRSPTGRTTQSPEPYRTRAATVADANNVGARCVAAGRGRVGVVGMPRTQQLRPGAAHRSIRQFWALGSRMPGVGVAVRLRESRHHVRAKLGDGPDVPEPRRA